MSSCCLLTFIALLSSAASYRSLPPSSLVVSKRNARADELLSDLLNKYVKNDQVKLSYQQPSPDQLSYQQPSVDQLSYQQPSVDQLSYQQPSVDQLSYQQHSLDQLSYQQPSLSKAQSRSLFRGSSVLSYHGVPTPPPHREQSQSPQTRLSEPQIFQTFSKSIGQPVPLSASPTRDQTIAPQGQYQSFYDPSPSLKQSPSVEPKSSEELTSNVVIKPFTFFNSPTKQETHETFFSPLVKPQQSIPQQTRPQQTRLQEGIHIQARPQEGIPQQARPHIGISQLAGPLQGITQQTPILQTKPYEVRSQPEVDSYQPQPVFTVFASKHQSLDKTEEVQQQQQHQQLQPQRQPQPQKQPTLFSPFTAPDPRHNEVGVDHLFSSNLRPTKSFSLEPVQKHTSQIFQTLEPHFGKGMSSVPVQKNIQQFVQPQSPQSVQKYTPHSLQQQFVQAASVLPIQQNSPQSLFQTINQPAADRDVRKKQDRKSGKKKMGKSAALTQLMAIAGDNWEEKLLSGKDNLSAESSSDFVCPGLDGFFPSPSSCSVYYQCAQGTAHKHSCQAGLVWNTLTLQCDWAESVACGGNTP